MSYYEQDDKQYLDPNTGKYYTKQIYQPMNYGGFWGGMGNSYNYGSPYGSMYGINNRYSTPREIRNYTGDVSQVWNLMKNRQPYQYNVPSLASLFPTMAAPAMGNMQQTQYTGGAGQFLGGLLGSNPLATGTASSGAGRFA